MCLQQSRLSGWECVVFIGWSNIPHQVGRWAIFPGALEGRKSLPVDQCLPGGGGQLAEHILLLISLSSGSDFFFYLHQQFFLTSHAFTSSVSQRLVKMMAPLM